MNLKAYFRDFRSYRESYMDEQVGRFIQGSLIMVVFGLLSLFLVTQTKLFANEPKPAELISLYTKAVFTFGFGVVLAFIGRFIKAMTSKRLVSDYYYDIIITLSVFLYMKWGSHAIFLVNPDNKTGDCLVWAMVYAGIGCFLYMEPFRYNALIIINLGLTFWGVPRYTGYALGWGTKYNMIVYGIIIGFWMTMKYLMGLKGFHRRRSMEQYGREKVSFLFNVSGELTQNLRNMQARTDAILKNGKDGVLYKDALELQSQITIMNSMAEDVADLAKMESGQFESTVTPYKTERFLNDIVGAARVYTECRGLEFKYTFSETIPSVLRGDEKRLRQIILRVLSNSVRYTQEGSISLFVDFDMVEPLKGNLVIRVSDTGIGIQPEELERFRARLSKLKTKKAGRGEGPNLGLSVAAGMVFAMDGEFTISSVYRRGTEICIVLTQEVVSTSVIKGHGSEESATE